MQFDPTSATSIANAITTLLNDPTLRDALIAKGNERVKLFSWRELARKTAAVYASLNREMR